MMEDSKTPGKVGLLLSNVKFSSYCDLHEKCLKKTNLSHVGLHFSLIPQMGFTSNSKHLKTICYVSGMHLNTFPYSFHSSTHFPASQPARHTLPGGTVSAPSCLSLAGRQRPPTPSWVLISSAVVSKDKVFLGKMLLHDHLCDSGCFRKGSLLVVCSSRAASQAGTPFL